MMKRFFVAFLIWTVVLAVLMFFFAAFLFDRQHIYRAALPIAFVFAAITHGFETQAEKIKTLERRLENLEQTEETKE